MPADTRLLSDRFPRANAYHPDWLLSGVSGGANPLWLAEWLGEVMDWKPGMRVLDLGCGRALSSLFLRREFGVEVWATDLWFSATENARRVRDAGCEGGVFPVHADARHLPFPQEFFDAIVSIDSFFYYGTDDLYLGNVLRFLKPGGQLGIAGAALNEFDGPVPEHLRRWLDPEPEMACLHSASWWRRHWERSRLVDVEVADAMPDGWKYWLDWQRVVCPENVVEMTAVETDAGRNVGYVRAVCRRKPSTALRDPVSSVPTEYGKKEMLRINPN
jgi:SAM-dependent methyltransferase